MRKHLIIAGDPKNKPEESYKYIVKEDKYFILVQNNVLSKCEVVLTKDQILNMADWIKTLEV